ncbi:hypothetical protein KIH87_16765 [Paraneptunicella aestuarii]|uniref:hypothetical protein n=1 Tax=Paraneptunicella aestuarii TaxID=2831148 RepID=UPI001E62AD8F|nr:hypothetical protein [Paraneptunicella aestuarii]UAA38317.1 hypothetical protein KIH87_16765 [Paraneptunicella aestuarii]
MDSVISQLKENLQVLYRKAIDADASLAKLQAQGKGKFGSIFEESIGFQISSKQFKPYVEELSKDVDLLQGANEEEMQQSLTDVVKKMEIMFKTLAQFQQSLKD